MAGTATGKIDGMFYLLGGFFGAFLFGETEKYFTSWWNNAGYLGRLTLDKVLTLPTGVVVVLVVLMALFMFWGAEQLERIFGKRDLRREPKIRIAGAAGLLAMSVVVMLIGDPSIEDRYDRVNFTRTENEVQVKYSADEMLANRLVFITPAETFKAKYNQSTNPVYIDVRRESDFNLYHLAEAINIPLDRIQDSIPILASEPSQNTVFILMSNGEAESIQGWKVLIAHGLTNSYILEGGVNNWIAFFGKREGFIANSTAGENDLGYFFPAALGDRYESCSPDPIEYEYLEFEERIILQLKRDKSGGGCG